jgi:hypothetical protein
MLSLALVKSESEKVLGMNGLLFGALIMLAGFAVYGATRRLRQHSSGTRAESENPETA